MFGILTLALHRLQSPRIIDIDAERLPIGFTTTTTESFESSFPRKRESRSPGLRDDTPGLTQHSCELDHKASISAGSSLAGWIPARATLGRNDGRRLEALKAPQPHPVWL